MTQYPFSDELETENLADSMFRMMLTQNQQVSQVMMKAFKIMSNAVLSSITRADPIPYHMSVLTGQMWVQELLDGHPDRIRNELGVGKHIFALLVDKLASQGFTNSRHVLLEEQLAILLYTCITGLTCRHVGERFQRSNSMISKYVFFFSSQPSLTSLDTSA